MLRVETANLASGLLPARALRSRRLHPSPAPASAARRVSTSGRELMLPPPVVPAPPAATPPTTATSSIGEQLAAALEQGSDSLPDDRWSLRLELQDAEIARLYAQGLTRGALVWRAGMAEWRPLLITPELSRLLHRTPILLRDVTDASLDDEVTLPRPARPPSGVGVDDQAEGSARDIPTVAPTALDVAPPAHSGATRRTSELLAVAVFAFGLAWFARGGDSAAPAPELRAAAAAPAAVPPVLPPPSSALAATTGPLIPIVALTDLPLLGAATDGGASAPSRWAARVTRRSSAAPSTPGGSPTRSQLMAALNQVANVASGCGERGGPVRVVVTFAGSGVARSIQVSGKELPSLVRSCIIGAASRARVASFSGDPVTVSKTL